MITQVKTTVVGNNDRPQILLEKRFIIAKSVEGEQSSIFVYDKLEQLIVFKFIFTNRTDGMKAHEFCLNNYNRRNVIDVTEYPMTEAELLSTNLSKKANIRLHFKRIIQIQQALTKHKIPLENLDAKFLKESAKTAVYIWDEIKNIVRGDIKIVYDFSTGMYTYYFKGIVAIKTYELDEIFRYYNIN